MRVFRDTFRTKDGKRKKCAGWTVEFRDHQDRTRRVGAFKDKKASEELGRKLEQLAALRAAGMQPDATLTQWLEGLSAKLRGRLVKIGLLDGRAVAAGKPLAEHLADYGQSLTDKGDGEKHIRDTVHRIESVLEGIGASLISEVDATSVQRYLADRRNAGLPHATSNRYLTAMKGFCNWLVREGRVSCSPVATLSGLNEHTDKRRIRRPLTREELSTVLAITFKQPARYGMSGPERAIGYRVASETGLRVAEMRSLTKSSFDLVHCHS